MRRFARQPLPGLPKSPRIFRAPITGLLHKCHRPSHLRNRCPPPQPCAIRAVLSPVSLKRRSSEPPPLGPSRRSGNLTLPAALGSGLQRNNRFCITGRPIPQTLGRVKNFRNRLHPKSLWERDRLVRRLPLHSTFCLLHSPPGGRAQRQISHSEKFANSHAHKELRLCLS